MTERNYELKLKKFLVDNVSFKINHSFKWPAGGANMNPSYERNILKIDSNTALVTLIFDIAAVEDCPFSLHVEVNGVFVLENWEEDETSRALITNNGSVILFPYLRQAISEITTISGLPTYVIPVQNVVALFDKEEKGKGAK